MGGSTRWFGLIGSLRVQRALDAIASLPQGANGVRLSAQALRPYSSFFKSFQPTRMM